MIFWGIFPISWSSTNVSTENNNLSFCYRFFVDENVHGKWLEICKALFIFFLEKNSILQKKTVKIKTVKKYYTMFINEIDDA